METFDKEFNESFQILFHTEFDDRSKYLEFLEQIKIISNPFERYVIWYEYFDVTFSSFREMETILNAILAQYGVTAFEYPEIMQFKSNIEKMGSLLDELVRFCWAEINSNKLDFSPDLEKVLRRVLALFHETFYVFRGQVN